MTMDEIEDIDIADRLRSIGYLKDKTYGEWGLEDHYLVDFSIEKGLQEASLHLNRKQDSFTNEMRPFLIDIICAEFFDSKRDIGIQEDGSITPTNRVKKIQEETLRVEYDTASSTAYRDVSTPYDRMIEHLRDQSYRALQNFRYHYPYYRWYDLEEGK